MFINPNNDRRLDTSDTYTHKTWVHRANDSRLNAYDRLSTKVFWQGASEAMSGSIEEAADLFETTPAHILDFCRTHEPTLLALRPDENDSYRWTVLQTEPMHNFFETVQDTIRYCGILDISLHPMHEQAEAYAKTLTCPNERRTFARQFNQRIRFLNDRTATGELNTLFRKAREGDVEAIETLKYLREQLRLKNARKLNKLL